MTAEKQAAFQILSYHETRDTEEMLSLKSTGQINKFIDKFLLKYSEDTLNYYVKEQDGKFLIDDFEKFKNDSKPSYFS